jgi:hypothetical protein
MPAPRKSKLRLEVESHGVNFETYRSRIKKGATHEQALSTALMRPPKLTKGDVINILALIAEREKLLDEAANLTDSVIADKFGVCKQTINEIARGEIHKHVYAEVCGKSLLKGKAR